MEAVTKQQVIAMSDATETKPHVRLEIDGIPHVMPPDMEAAVIRASKGLLAPLPKEMTTTQAAEFLDVSRSFVIKLITRGELPCRMVGKHRRIPTEALVAHREKMFQEASRAADEMVRIGQEMGLYDQQATPPVAGGR
jgi:excisionase family DNA binding protein